MSLEPALEGQPVGLLDATVCVAAVVAQGADLCVLLNQQSLPVFNEKGRPFPLLQKV